MSKLRKKSSSVNVNNYGLIASQGDWIYYNSTFGDYGKLYRMKADGSEREKLSDDNPCYINLIDDWIYYTSRIGCIGIYRIRTDSSERQRLNDDVVLGITVVADWVYYINASDNFKLYRIRTDGSGRQKLNDDNLFTLNIVDSWIIYSTYYKWDMEVNSDCGIFRIKTDGRERQKLSDDHSEYLTTCDKWIYYCNKSDKGTLYRIGIDGSDKRRINERHYLSDVLVANDGWVYYRTIIFRSKWAIFRIRTDGSDEQQLWTGYKPDYLNVVGDWIYYCINICNPNLLKAPAYMLYNDSGITDGFFRLKTDLSESQRLCNDRRWFLDFEIIGCWIYYRNGSNNFSLNRKRIDGDGHEMICEDVLKVCSIQDDWVYYTDRSSNGSLRRKKTDGSSGQLLNDNKIRNIVIDGDWIYYVNDGDGFRVYRMKVDGSGEHRLNGLCSDGIKVSDGWIYYISRNDYDLRRMRTDGSSKKKLNTGHSYCEVGEIVDIVDGWIYYLMFDGGYEDSFYPYLYRIKPDGSNKKKLCFCKEDEQIINNDLIFYYNIKGELHRMKNDGSDDQMIDNTPQTIDIACVTGDWIYYTKKSDCNNLYRIKTDGSSKQKLNEDDTLFIGLVDNWIYYQNRFDEFRFYRVKTDGSVRERIPG
jgi:hypothetical protein